ncbi:hypothetical protein A9W99_18735 [Mycobacterium sp. 1164966.3]|nr:hypothetical protein A9W99_18735 [Mycobacterium sp. 1164966.3]
MKHVDIAELRNAVLLACPAASVHNSQPWHWIADGRAVHLLVDHRQTVPAANHSGREAVLSGGAALDHLRVALTAAQWRTNITRFPNANKVARSATIDFSPIEDVTDGQRNRASDRRIVAPKGFRRAVMPVPGLATCPSDRDEPDSRHRARPHRQSRRTAGLDPRRNYAANEDLPARTARRPLDSVLEIR